MASHRLSGKLVVILHADVAGSTELVNRDEQLAHERIQETFRRFGEIITRYHGRVRELRGDALLAVFERASGAVSATLAFQADQKEYTRGLGDAIQPTVRVGIAMGEVVIADNTITGTGVVLAQRLEQMADPGGVVIQAAARETIPNRYPFAYTSLGEHLVKGFDQPVRAYEVELKGEVTIPQPDRVDHRIRNGVIALVSIAVIAGGATLLWLKPWEAREEPASVERMAFPLPDKPSIAVLPFDNLSDDKEQEFFADGLTNDIITDLSRFGDLMVIAANSTFTYKDKPVKVQQVAEELGVRYVVEGSIQKSGDQVRINAQFIDAITGEHLWAERYVRDFKDVFAVQDEITQKIVSSLGTWSGKVMEITLEGAKRKGTTDLTAYEHFVIGLQLLQRFNKNDNAKAREIFKKAIELDPQYARAHATLAWTHFFDWQRGWSESEELSATRAYEAAKTAVETDNNEAEAHWILTYINFWIKKRPEEALSGAERALALNPNHSDILADWGGFIMPFLTGNAEKGMELNKKAMRLNPSHPDWYEQALGVAAYMARKYKEAISVLRTVEYHGIESRLALAASYAQLGRLEEAKIEATKLMELHPEFSIREFTTDKLYFKEQADREHYVDGLRKAGFPEYPPLPLPDKPSIAVLPFTNMSGDPDQEYFADGMTDDLITDISRISGLFIVSRNSSFAYKGLSPDLRQVAKELSVRYILEGSVRRVGDDVRINAQLIDSTTGGHVWAERFDGSMMDVFSLQDEVNQKIVSALAINLTQDDRERLQHKRTSNPDAYDMLLRGLELYQRLNVNDNAEARKYFKKAAALDPNYARAYANLSWSHTTDVNMNWIEQQEESIRLAEEYANQAMALDDKIPQIYMSLSALYLAQRKHDAAVAMAQRTLELHPNYSDGYAIQAFVLSFVGKLDEALSSIKKAERNNPRSSFVYMFVEGHIRFLMGHYEQAKSVLQEAAERNPVFDRIHLLLAATYGHLGQSEDASWAVTEALTINPEITINYEQKNARYKRPKDFDLYIDGLRKAGLPE